MGPSNTNFYAPLIQMDEPSTISKRRKKRKPKMTESSNAPELTSPNPELPEILTTLVLDDNQNEVPQKRNKKRLSLSLQGSNLLPIGENSNQFLHPNSDFVNGEKKIMYCNCEVCLPKTPLHLRQSLPSTPTSAFTTSLNLYDPEYKPTDFSEFWISENVKWVLLKILIWSLQCLTLSSIIIVFYYWGISEHIVRLASNNITVFPFSLVKIVGQSYLYKDFSSWWLQSDANGLRSQLMQFFAPIYASLSHQFSFGFHLISSSEVIRTVVVVIAHIDLLFTTLSLVHHHIIFRHFSKPKPFPKMTQDQIMKMLYDVIRSIHPFPSHLPTNPKWLRQTVKGSVPIQWNNHIIHPNPTIATFLSGWFFNAKPCELRIGNIMEWLCWAYWGTEFFDNSSPPNRTSYIIPKYGTKPIRVDRKTLEDIEAVVNIVLKETGGAIPEGYDAKLKCIRLNVDKLVVRWRPGMFYFVTMLMHFLTHVILWLCGFELHEENGIKIWMSKSLVGRLSSNHRRQKELEPPITFLHGLGIGLLPYLPFMYFLHRKHPTRPMIFISITQSTMTLFTIPYATTFVSHAFSKLFPSLIPRPKRPVVRSPQFPSPDVFVKTVYGVYSRLKVKPGVFVAHSLGTALTTWLFKAQDILEASRFWESEDNAPNRSDTLKSDITGGRTNDFNPRSIISTYIAIDPISFGMFWRDVAYNFVYRKPVRWVDELLDYFAAKEVAISVCTISRGFYWFWSCMVRCDWERFSYTSQDNTVSVVDDDPITSTITNDVPMFVYLSEYDAIVNTEMVRRYLSRDGFPLENVKVMKSEDHATMLWGRKWWTDIATRI
ncbi:hypothetical protein BKA69DRAFT_1127392 [Paraphysoderma sedebokerense]|nr:hypothetical protein BKA69DRAFT_1127392 [Paraphysoderma sedebokerense]